jgi:AraC family transcriptional regulator of adaptative response/methylated-DNA-[protein]-cysteine methyltransferase
MKVTRQTINYERIEQAITYLQENFHRQPELSEVADRVHISPFHFQRLFSEWAGISPKRFLQYLTAAYLKEKIKETRNLTEAAEAAGLSSQSRIYDLFTTLEAVTPQEYKSHGNGLIIDYGFHETPFGLCLIGITQRGVCWLSFIQPEQGRQHELDSMKEFWHNSVIHLNQEVTGKYVRTIFHRNEAGRQRKLHLVVKGTNFQVKVWEALLKIPLGTVTTYQHIAEQLHKPKALQAVGLAVGANHIAYLIPCHRVIRKDGILGGYRWHATRKKCMVGWEMAAAEPGGE